MAKRTLPRLETFPNPSPKRDYVIRHIAPEFTSRCPITGQPDFGTVTIEYTPDRLCVELKSLKFYLQAFREEGIFYEDLSGQVLHDDELARLLTFPNVLITSHQAFLTREALADIARTTIANLDALATGKPFVEHSVLT